MDQQKKTLPKWPFYVASTLLFLLAFSSTLGSTPSGIVLFFAAITGTLGALLLVVPFVITHLFSPKEGLDIEELRECFQPVLSALANAELKISSAASQTQRASQSIESLIRLGNPTPPETEPNVITFESAAQEEPEQDEFDIELEMDTEALQEDEPEDQGPIEVRIIAHAQLGVGSKLYIRGEGQDALSWEQGEPMNYRSTGEWEWIGATENKITFQIYKNDDEADMEGKQSLNPGDTVTIRPSF